LAPAPLAGSASAAGLSATVVAGGASASSLIAKGTIHMILMHQLKLLVAVFAALIFISLLGTAAVALQHSRTLTPPGSPNAVPASAPAPGPTQVNFAKVIELTINDDGVGHDECVDFDAGKTITGPRDGWASQEEGLKWFRSTGADAHCETDPGESGLYGRDLVIIPVDNDRWDKATPAEIADEMKDAMHKSPVMSADGELPQTYQFRTREGGIGILQIVQIHRDEQNHGWIKVKYRLVK